MIKKLVTEFHFLGSNLNVLKTIVEGNNLACQDCKSSKNPTIIFNSELLKRADGNNTTEMLNVLNHFNNYWNGLNMLTPSLSETGSQSITKFEPVTLKDLTTFSSLYFLNTNINNIPNLKKITESKLLNYSLSNTKKKIVKKLFLDQNSISDINSTVYNSIFSLESNYYYLPKNIFYENEETFINTEGLIKRTTKLIFRKKTKNNWQILRKLFKQFKTNLTFLNSKDNQIIFFNSKKITNFKNFVYFHYSATQSLTNLNFYLSVKTQPFILNNNKYRVKTTKINKTKLRYWLDDFFSGSKDEYSQNSLILTNCSRILRSEATNFF